MKDFDEIPQQQVGMERSLLVERNVLRVAGINVTVPEGSHLPGSGQEKLILNTVSSLRSKGSDLGSKETEEEHLLRDIYCTWCFSYTI